MTIIQTFINLFKPKIEPLNIPSGSRPYIDLFNEPHMNDNKEYVLKAVSQKPHHMGNYYFASERLQLDRDVALAALYNKQAIYVCKNFSNDKEIMLAAIKLDYNNYEYLSENLKDDKDILLELIRYVSGLWYGNYHKYINDYPFIHQLLSINPEVSKYFPYDKQQYDNYIKLNNLYNHLNETIETNLTKPKRTKL